jgi:hypothetical protein
MLSFISLSSVIIESSPLTLLNRLYRETWVSTKVTCRTSSLVKLHVKVHSFYIRDIKRFGLAREVSCTENQ